MRGHAHSPSRERGSTSCSPTSEDAARVARTLLVGALGGCVAERLGSPLPWMLGSAASTTLARYMGLKPSSPRWLRLVMQAVVGSLLGAQFRSDFPAVAKNSACSVTCLLLMTFFATLVGTFYHLRVARCDSTTALLAAAPGGLNDMLLLAMEMGADQKAIGLTHICRVLCITVLLPSLLRNLAAASSAPSLRPVALPLPPIVGTSDWAVLLLCAAAGPVLARRLPARFLLGPLLLTAAARLTGLTVAKLPSWMGRMAQCALGSSLATRLAATGASPMEVLGAVATGLAATLLLLLLSVAAAFLVHAVKGNSMPLPLLVLSFSPGGMTEMCLTALSMGYDVAFVAAHHALRLTFLLLCLPLVAGSRRWKRPSGGSDATAPLLPA